MRRKERGRSWNRVIKNRRNQKKCKRSNKMGSHLMVWWSLHTWESATQWAIAGETKRRPDLNGDCCSWLLSNVKWILNISERGPETDDGCINISQGEKVAKKTDTRSYPDNEPSLYFPQPLLPQIALINTNLVKSFPAASYRSHISSVSAQKILFLNNN